MAHRDERLRSAFRLVPTLANFTPKRMLILPYPERKVGVEKQTCARFPGTTAGPSTAEFPKPKLYGAHTRTRPTVSFDPKPTRTGFSARLRPKAVPASVMKRLIHGQGAEVPTVDILSEERR